MGDNSVVVANDEFGIAAYLASDAVVVNEDKYSTAAAIKVFDEFLRKYATDQGAVARQVVLLALAEVCCKGTSAKRFNSKAVILVPSHGVHCTLGDFVSLIPTDRENMLRVWSESMPQFANMTHALIKNKPTLRQEVQKASQCSYEMAPVGFDYASSIDDKYWNQLSTVEKHFIYSNTTRKAGPARSHVAEQETVSGGVEVHATPNGFVPGRAGALMPSANNVGRPSGAGAAGIYGN